MKIIYTRTGDITIDDVTEQQLGSVISILRAQLESQTPPALKLVTDEPEITPEPIEGDEQSLPFKDASPLVKHWMTGLTENQRKTIRAIIFIKMNPGVETHTLMNEIWGKGSAIKLGRRKTGTFASVMNPRLKPFGLSSRDIFQTTKIGISTYWRVDDKIDQLMPKIFGLTMSEAEDCLTNPEITRSI